MRAVRYHGRRDLRIEEIDQPESGPDDVLIDIEAAGICGSDLHEYTTGPITIPDEPHPITGEQLPVTMGHEFSGVVTGSGANVSISEGTRVAVNPVVWCGGCRYCREGNYNRCDPGGFIGLSGDGGFSERVAVSEKKVVPLPDGVSTEEAALVEPFTTALHAVGRTGIEAGDTVAVFGCGPIGLMIVQGIRAAGAGRIVAVEPLNARRDRATKCGADVLVDPTETDPVEAIKSETSDGADAAIEVAGIEPTINQALRCTRRGGRITIVSLFEDAVEVQPNDVVLGERTVTGTLAYLGGPLADREFGTVLRYFQDGTFDPEPLVTSRIDLDAIIDEGFECLLNEDSDEVKVLVRP